MDVTERVIIGLPLESLWDSGVLEAERGRELTEADLKALLRLGAITFVVADVGHALNWVSPAECFEFWKTKVQPHLHKRARPYLADYPDEYFYIAHEWRLRDGRIVVVLEKHH